MASVLIGHSCDVWSLGMTTVLRQQGHDVVGLCSEIDRFIQLAARWRPSLLIIAKGLLGPADLQRLKGSQSGGAAASIVVVVDEREVLAGQNFREHCDALLLSGSTLGEVIECVCAVAAGHRWIDPQIDHLIEGESPQPAPSSSLSRREAEVAGLAISGLSNKAIARLLGVSDGTIKMHMHHILNKLGLTSRLQMQAAAEKDCSMFSSPAPLAVAPLDDLRRSSAVRPPRTRASAELLPELS